MDLASNAFVSLKFVRKIILTIYGLVTPLQISTCGIVYKRQVKWNIIKNSIEYPLLPPWLLGFGAVYVPINRHFK